jgi:hypothetical protein
MTVTKYFGTEERVVYPFYYPALIGTKQTDGTREVFQHPIPGSLPPDARRLELNNGNQLLGYLYVRVHDTPLRTVRAVLVSLSALLIGAAGLFALQFRRQEKVITRTTIALEEKKRELVRLERLALAGQLSANVFHDLKKPVLNIKNELDEEGAPAGFSKRVREQIDLFFGIIRESNLERFVRAQSEREFVDINEMLERSLALVRYERGHAEIVKNLAPGLPSVLAEPVRLIQVFSNIILNAYQSMESAGRLTVSTRWQIANRDCGFGERDSFQRYRNNFSAVLYHEAGGHWNGAWTLHQPRHHSGNRRDDSRHEFSTRDDFHHRNSRAVIFPFYLPSNTVCTVGVVPSSLAAVHLMALTSQWCKSDDNSG